jgi:membrane protease YdiL (CAAX protease family)
MTQETQTPLAESLAAEPGLSATPLALPAADEYRGLEWVFLGGHGLRAGWSVAVFAFLMYVFVRVLELLFYSAHLVGGAFAPRSAFFGEAIWLLALLAAAAIVAAIQQHSIVDFHLAGPAPSLHFLSGLVAGFAALSALVGALAWGGWLHFGPTALSGLPIFKYAVLWAAAFLLVGCFEEGAFRGYLQATLARGINFWWALAVVAALCGWLLVTASGVGVWGVYLMALLGLGPCFWLHRAAGSRAAFWQAAWVTSTAFGFIHTGNNGENWIGIFAAAAIGFVFCVSVWVTGSVWWAIGCHAAWDWAETYFYGAADSGNVARGHFLSTSPDGNALWSGGADGPEGSILVIAVILLLLAVLLVIHGRKSRLPLAIPGNGPQAPAPAN